MRRTILILIELENYPETVVRRAARVARLYDAELELVLSEPTAHYLKDNYIISAEVQQIADDISLAEDEILARLTARAEEAGIKARASVLKDRAVGDAVVDMANRIDALFVVKGTHYHSPAERATFSDTDWQLIRRLDRGLWFVKPGDFPEQPVIVAAVDPTHTHDRAATLDQRIVAAALDLARRSGGRLDVVHTYQRLAEIGRHATWAYKPEKLPIDELDERIREEHRRQLEAFAGSNQVPVNALHLLPGRPHEILPSFARTRGAHVVVMGAISRSGLKSRIVGQTAERTLDHLPCDVLIVHPG